MAAARTPEEIAELARQGAVTKQTEINNDSVALATDLTKLTRFEARLFKRTGKNLQA